MHNELWLFAYGSLLWRPGVEYDLSDEGRVTGWTRRFWQGSPDHRGTATSPGRVVTLVRQAGQVTGRLYRLSGNDLHQTLRYLDHRESGGYSRCWVTVSRSESPPIRALTYVALPGNRYYLGPVESSELAAHIQRSKGPSGNNIDYYHDLIESLSRLTLSPGELAAVRLPTLHKA